MFGRTIVVVTLTCMFASNAYAQARQQTLHEQDTDRPGADIAATEVGSDPAICEALCDDDASCVAWTYVKPEATGGSAMCWTKFEVPEPVASECCISGLKSTTQVREAAPASIAVTGFEPEVVDPSVQEERIVDGPEADLVIRVGDVDNLGFGWPDSFRLFEGETTPSHPWPWSPSDGDAAGMDKILVSTSFKGPVEGDGYHATQEAVPAQAVSIPLGELPPVITDAVLQIFVDDFQAPRTGSSFSIKINSEPAELASRLLNSVDQTGPVGKLITLPLPENLRLEAGQTLELLIDDPTTGAGDGWAIDFVRLLINPRPPLRAASLTGIVLDEETREPVVLADVTTASGTAQTDQDGRFILAPVYAGLALVEAAHPDYLPGSAQADIPQGEVGDVEILLKKSRVSSCVGLVNDLNTTGRAILRGLNFASASADLDNSSLEALRAAYELLSTTEGSWAIEGHTDNVGSRPYNVELSRARAQAVRAWLLNEGIPGHRISSDGFAFDRPMASNETEAGRALNRRVEIVPVGASVDSPISACEAGLSTGEADKTEFAEADEQPETTAVEAKVPADARGTGPALVQQTASDIAHGASSELLRRIQSTGAVLDEVAADLDPKLAIFGRNVPELAADFVRKVAYLPYEGVLRGADGVLISGAGNDLDQALALASVIRGTQDAKLRIRSGIIADDDRFRLFNRLSLPVPDMTSLALRDELAERLDVEVSAEDIDLSRFLEPMLAQIPVASSVDHGIIPERYHWLEWQDPNGNWVALHTAFGLDATPTMVEQGEVFEVEVPEHLLHQVSVQPVAELVSSGEPRLIELTDAWKRPVSQAVRMTPQFELINAGEQDRPVWGIRIEGILQENSLTGNGILGPIDALSSAEGAFFDTVGGLLENAGSVLDTAESGDALETARISRIGLRIELSGPGVAPHGETHWWLDEAELGILGRNPDAEYRSSFLSVSTGDETQASLAKADLEATSLALRNLARVLTAANAEGADSVVDLPPGRREEFLVALGEQFPGVGISGTLARSILAHPAANVGGLSWRPSAAAVVVTRAPEAGSFGTVRTDILRNPQVVIKQDEDGGWLRDVSTAFEMGLRDTLAEAAVFGLPSQYLSAAATSQSFDPSRLLPADSSAYEADSAKGYTVKPISLQPALWWRWNAETGEFLGRSRFGGADGTEYNITSAKIALSLGDTVRLFAGTKVGLSECESKYASDAAGYDCCIKVVTGQAAVSFVAGQAIGAGSEAVLADAFKTVGSGLLGILSGLTIDLAMLSFNAESRICGGD